MKMILNCMLAPCNLQVILNILGGSLSEMLMQLMVWYCIGRGLLLLSPWLVGERIFHLHDEAMVNHKHYLLAVALLTVVGCGRLEKDVLNAPADNELDRYGLESV